MLVLNLPFKALMFLTLMRPSLVLFLVLWLKLVKDFLKVRCRLALLPFLISCLIWLDLVASLPLIKEMILVIILLLHFLSLMLGSVLVLMLPLLVWLTPDLRIKKSLLKCNWTIRKRLPRCKMRLKKRLLAFSRRLHARIRKTRYMHKMRCLLINRRSLLLALRLLWKTPIFRSEERFSRNAETDLVCRLLLEKKNESVIKTHHDDVENMLSGTELLYRAQYGYATDVSRIRIKVIMMRDINLGTIESGAAIIID